MNIIRVRFIFGNLKIPRAARTLASIERGQRRGEIASSSFIVGKNFTGAFPRIGARLFASAAYPRHRIIDSIRTLPLYFSNHDFMTVERDACYEPALEWTSRVYRELDERVSLSLSLSLVSISSIDDNIRVRLTERLNVDIWRHFSVLGLPSPLQPELSEIFTSGVSWKKSATSAAT